MGYGGSPYCLEHCNRFNVQIVHIGKDYYSSDTCSFVCNSGGRFNTLYRGIIKCNTIIIRMMQVLMTLV